jgi:hypothetical protein
MELGNLSTLVSLLIALSVASERLVEIIKGVIPFLNCTNDDPTKEGWRKAALQALAVVAGIITALLARSAIGESVPAVLNSTPGFLALGLLASGGSGFWNSILTYVNKVKDIKALEAKEKKEG